MNAQEIKAFTPEERSRKRPSPDASYARLRELLKLSQRGKPLLDAINKG